MLGGALLGGGATYLITRAVRGGALGAAGDNKNAAAVAMRQIRRYAFASSQDKSPVVGITHASYALVLLDTLEEVAGRDNLKKSGVDPTKLRAFITANQDRHAEALRQCDPYLQEVLRLEREAGDQLPGFVVAGAGAAPRGA